MPEASADFVELSADVVAAYVSNNSVTRADLPALISTVHAALKHAAEGTREPRALGTTGSDQQDGLSGSHHQP